MMFSSSEARAGSRAGAGFGVKTDVRGKGVEVTNEVILSGTVWDHLLPLLLQ